DDLPTGGAVYLDTVFIEIVIPTIELSLGCAACVGRSLVEYIRVLREELDVWDRKICFSSRRRHTSCSRDWSSEVCSSDLAARRHRRRHGREPRDAARLRVSPRDHA